MLQDVHKDILFGLMNSCPKIFTELFGINLIMKIIAFLVMASMIGCVSKSEFDKKEHENEVLRKKIEDLEAELEEKKRIGTCTEDFALEKLKSYLSFYASKCVFKEFKVRTNGECTYDIRMNKYIESEVVGIIVRLKFNDDGTFTVSNIENDPIWACNQ